MVSVLQVGFLTLKAIGHNLLLRWLLATSKAHIHVFASCLGAHVATSGPFSPKKEHRKPATRQIGRWVKCLQGLLNRQDGNERMAFGSTVSHSQVVKLRNSRGPNLAEIPAVEGAGPWLVQILRGSCSGELPLSHLWTVLRILPGKVGGGGYGENRP